MFIMQFIVFKSENAPTIHQIYNIHQPYVMRLGILCVLFRHPIRLTKITYTK